jgi:hypothetical protein
LVLSSFWQLTYEEAVHKLMKVQIQEGMEVRRVHFPSVYCLGAHAFPSLLVLSVHLQIELANMVIECCSQERSYSSFYGLIGERFCKINRIWCEAFELAFSNYYETIHRYETNRLRNIGRFFGHLLASDGISWGVFHVVHMNEEETTSSSRIFVKILLQEMTEELGVKKLAARFGEPTMQGAYQNVFPIDNPKNTRFSINYFTSIGLGAVTEKMREHLTVRFLASFLECFPLLHLTRLTLLSLPFFPSEHASAHPRATAKGSRSRIVRLFLLGLLERQFLILLRLRLRLVRFRLWLRPLPTTPSTTTISLVVPISISFSFSLRLSFASPCPNPTTFVDSSPLSTTSLALASSSQTTRRLAPTPTCGWRRWRRRREGLAPTSTKRRVAPPKEAKGELDAAEEKIRWRYAA